jgi:hypothetical protein
MKTFEYKNIELDNIKSYLKNSFKLMFRRPFYSFIPFLMLTVLICSLMSVNLFIGFIFMIILSMTLVPILSLDLSYSNDFSKIPFKSIKYSQLYSAKTVFKQVFYPFFIIIMFSSFLSGAFLIWDIVFSSHLGNEMIIPDESKSKDNLSLWTMILGSIFFFMVSIILSAIICLAYYVVFNLTLVSLPTLLNSIPQTEYLTYKFYDVMRQNEINFIKIFAPLSFIQALSSLILPPKLDFLIWSLITTFGVSTCYIIAKEMSGGGDGLMEKKSLINSITDGEIKLVTDKS